MKKATNVLLSVMLLTIMLIINSGTAKLSEEESQKEFKDKSEINKEYLVDIDLLEQMGIMGGYEDNTFRPKEKMTRAEMAKIAYKLTNKGKEEEKSVEKSAFKDVEEWHWAKGYINYCKEKGYINGVGENRYESEREITLKEVSLILNRIMPEYKKYDNIGAPQREKEEEAIATAEATRERIAKLIYEAIFRKYKTKTYGEKELGFEKVKGVIVANEEKYIEIDENGERLPGAIGRSEKGKSVIYIKGKYKTINKVFPRELLGEKVEFLSYPTKNGDIGIASSLLIDRSFEHEEFKKRTVLIKKSSYDKEREVATAKLEFINYRPDWAALEEGYCDIIKVPEEEKLEDFENDKKAGMVYRYKEENGKFDLSVSPGPIHLPEPADIMIRNGNLYINGELQWISNLANVVVYCQIATEEGKCVPVSASMRGIYDMKHGCTKNVENGEETEVLLNSVLYEENSPIIRSIVLTVDATE